MASCSYLIVRLLELRLLLHGRDRLDVRDEAAAAFALSSLDRVGGRQPLVGAMMPPSAWWWVHAEALDMFKLQEEMEVGTDAHAEWVAEVRARRARHESSE